MPKILIIKVGTTLPSLLAGFSNTIRVHLSHSQSVLWLPNGAKRLASSAID